MTGSDSQELHDAIDAVWRIEQARLIAALARMTGDVGRAEDLARPTEQTAPRRPIAAIRATTSRGA